MKAALCISYGTNILSFIDQFSVAGFMSSII